jgi:hypothetical protein
MIVYKTRDISVYDSLHKIKRNQIFIVKSETQNLEPMLPSSLTYFIIKYCKSYDTQRKYATELCAFINYISSNVYKENNELFLSLKFKGLSGLTFHHLAHYINYISNDPFEPIAYETAKAKEDIIYLFYKYMNLSKINNINGTIIEKIDLLNSQKSNIKSRNISPFDLCPEIIIAYPKQITKSNRVLKDMQEELWNLLVEFAEEYYLSIAFGVLILICGGSRRGECVNLFVKDVRLHKQNHLLYLDIKDNQYELFGDREININNSQVKKERKKQPVLPLHSRISEIYENHLNYLKKVYNTQNIKNKALFVNSDGFPMSGDSFSELFRDLKRNFIDFLENEGLPALAQQMREYRWGSHIGRHIFTNTIVKKGYANGSGNKPIPKLVALLRGDSSEESSMVYIDDYTLSEAVAKNINDISKIAVEYNKNDDAQI